MLTLATDVCRMAKASGADDADVLLGAGTEFSVTIRRQEVENIVEASSRALGLRVIKGGRVAVSYSSDFTPDSLREFVAKTVEMAAISDVDEAAGLPEEGYGAVPVGDLYDSDIEDMDADRAIELARRCEQAAFDADSRITNSGGASYGYNTGVHVLANSRGFAGTSQASGCSLSVEVMADDADGKKQNDYWYTADRFFHNLEDPESVGRQATTRAVRKIGARKVPTREVPVVWDPQVSRALVSLLARAASGEPLYRRSTFLLDMEGQALASPLLSLVDDPLLGGKLGSREFDGEGLTSVRNELFRQGTFVQFLLDTYTARKTGRASTHSAVRGVGGTPGVGTSNLVLEPGASSPADIIGSVEDGLYLTELLGFGDNITTGDFSRGAAGLWIEHGQLTYPVAEINVSGNLKDMVKAVDMVGNDLDWRAPIAAPTLRIGRLMVSGL
ncbi:MAG: TldD/PmbA family protein [Chloroflexi bacterium]|nr:TldD/PmbA family protein [Chloroflexota bacterium]